MNISVVSVLMQEKLYGPNYSLYCLIALCLRLLTLNHYTLTAVEIAFLRPHEASKILSCLKDGLPQFVLLCQIVLDDSKTENIHKHTHWAESICE